MNVKDLLAWLKDKDENQKFKYYFYPNFFVDEKILKIEIQNSNSGTVISDIIKRIESDIERIREYEKDSLKERLVLTKIKIILVIFEESYLLTYRMLNRMLEKKPIFDLLKRNIKYDENGEMIDSDEDEEFKEEVRRHVDLYLAKFHKVDLPTPEELFGKPEEGGIGGKLPETMDRVYRNDLEILKDAVIQKQTEELNNKYGLQSKTSYETIKITDDRIKETEKVLHESPISKIIEKHKQQIIEEIKRVFMNWLG